MADTSQQRHALRAGPVVLVTSPHAGHAQRAEELTRLLAEAGIAVGLQVGVAELYEHQPQGSVWREAGCTAAVAAGGDGTVGTVATHLAGSGLPLGILPMGTSNDVARSLDIPLDLAAACRVIAAGEVLALDAGQVVPALAKPGALAVHETANPPQGADAPTPQSGAYFLHAATLGLNVEFARLATDADRRARLRGLTYPASALEALRRFRPMRATLRFPAGLADGDHARIRSTAVPLDGDQGQHRRADLTHRAEREQVIECTVLTVLTVNTPVFGGALELRVPGVELRDRLLDFIVIEAPERTGLRWRIQDLRQHVEDLREGMSRLFEQHVRRDSEPTAQAQPWERWQSVAQAPDDLTFKLPGLHHFQARSLIIETDEPMDLTMDGEVRSHTPALVRVAPEPVPIFVPAGYV